MEASLQPRKLGWADAAALVVFVVSLLLVGYYRSRGCMLWADEIMGMLVLQQPSFSGVLHLWRAGVDSSGIWFYVLGRPWLAVFGHSEMALRMFSACGVAASAAVLWIAARRFYEFLVVLASVPLVYLSTVALRWQLSNGRTYGLFLTGCALALLMLFLGEEEKQRKPTWRFLLATFAVHSFLCGSHFLGVLYSGAFLATQGLFDFAARRFRPFLYLSIVCSWVVALFTLPNIRATANLGKPTFWTLRPIVKQLFTSSILLQRYVVVVMAALLLLAFLQLRYERSRRPVYLLFLAFGFLDVFIFALSRRGPSIYVDRYLLPFSLIAVLALCELQRQVREHAGPQRWFRTALPVLLLVVSLVYIRHMWTVSQWPLPYPNYTAAFLGGLPPGVPLVDTDTGSFLELEYYGHDSSGRHIVFPDDRAVAFAPVNAANVSGANSVHNLPLVGLYQRDVLPTSTVLSTGKPFLVITGMSDHGLWFKERVLTDPHLTETRLRSPSPGLFNPELWLVSPH